MGKKVMSRESTTSTNEWENDKIDGLFGVYTPGKERKEGVKSS